MELEASTKSKLKEDVSGPRGESGMNECRSQKLQNWLLIEHLVLDFFLLGVGLAEMNVKSSNHLMEPEEVCDG